jgi:Tfp pilus assembly protein PilO
MNKLGSKEIFLILVIINFLLYYIAYMCVISPLGSKSKGYSAEIASLQQEYDADMVIVSSKDEYISKNETLKQEKETLFNNSFPDAETENLHAYMVDRAKESGVTIASISLSQSASTTQDENGESVPTGLKDNNIVLSVSGSYANIIKFVTDIENAKKTSLLTSLSFAGSAGQMTSSINYYFMTVDKGDDITDTTLDHTFGQGLGDEALFK